jgi:hypothetical protein
MKIYLTKIQYYALMNIYGPPANVHHMIMAAELKDGKYFIEENDEEDFEDLLNLISEEIGEGLCSKKDAISLLGVCKKVDPNSLNWIGA